jgi:crotonobetainyl-CoA:carnitine CoA-transferase CaiB-like acyl-CoA transferase
MSSTRPLDDLVVVDLTAARAGPQCVRQLGDWGADVIRIEPPTRRAADLGDRQGSDFQNLHRNKRSLALDLKTDAGREALLRLVARADVVVENMRPAAKHRLGIDYDAVRAVNPRIVYASISGFGQDGPGADRGGVDQIAQGAGGLMSVTGFPDGDPVRAGFAVTDLAAGLHCAIGILVALHERERTGGGRWVRTSLLEAAIAMLDFQAVRWTVDGVEPQRQGNEHPTIAPMGAFATADGWINVAGWDGPIWTAFATVLGHEALLDDPRFATPADRTRHRDALNAEIGPRLLTDSTAAWLERFDAAGVPAGPVNTVGQALEDPQVAHLGIVQEVDHPALGALRLVANAFSLSGLSRGLDRPAPECGQHSEEILRDLGYAGAGLEALLAAGGR